MRETQILRGLHKARAKMGNNFEYGMVPGNDPLAGQYGHAAVGAPVDQGAAMDRKLLSEGLAGAPQAVPASVPAKGMSLQQSAVRSAGLANQAQMTTGAPTGVMNVASSASDNNSLRMLSRGVAKLKGPGTTTSDSIPANLSRGEAVLPAKTVQKVGANNIARLIEKTNGKPPARGLRAGYAGGKVPLQPLQPNVFGDVADDLLGRKVVPPEARGAAAMNNMAQTLNRGQPVAASGAYTITPEAQAMKDAARARVQNPPVQPQPTTAPQAAVESPLPAQGAKPSAPAATSITTQEPPAGLKGAVNRAKNWVTSKPQGYVAPPASPVAAVARPPSYELGKGVGRAVGGQGTGLSSPSPGLAAGAAITSAVDSIDRPTEDYYRRFGMNPNEDRGLGKDLAVRGAGVMTDLGATLLDTPVGVANTLSKLVGGKGDFQLPGGSFTSITRRYDTPQASPESAAAQSAASAVESAKVASATTAAANTRLQHQGPMGDDVNPYHGDLSAQINAAMKNGQTNLASTGMRANDIYKTKQANGTVAYSGYGDGTGRTGKLVSGDGTALQGNGTVSTMPNDQTARTLSSAQSGATSAALQAAAARGDMDTVRQHYQSSGGTFAGRTAAQDAPDNSPQGLIMAQIQRGLASGQKLTPAGVAALQALNTTDKNYKANMFGHEISRDNSLRGNQIAREGYEKDLAIAANTNKRLLTMDGMDRTSAGSKAVDDYIKTASSAVGVDDKGVAKLDAQRAADLSKYIFSQVQPIQTKYGPMTLAEAASRDPDAFKVAAERLDSEKSLDDLINASAGRSITGVGSQNGGRTELAGSTRQNAGLINEVLSHKVPVGSALASHALMPFTDSTMVDFKDGRGGIVSVPLREIAKDRHAYTALQAMFAQQKGQ